MPNYPNSSLSRSGGICLSIGGVLIAVAAFALSKIGVSPKGDTPDIDLVFYSLSWLFVILGIGLAMWGIVLILAHSKVERHWCPDPEAHFLHAGSPMAEGSTPESGQFPLMRTSGVPSIDADGQLLSVLRQIRMVLIRNRELLQGALETGRYWPVGGDQIQNKVWKKNRTKLLEQSEISVDLFDSLETAFSHVERISRFLGPRRWTNHSRPKDGDDLAGAYQALLAAEIQIDQLLDPKNPDEQGSTI